MRSRLAAAILLLAAPAFSQTLSLLDVPFVPQSEALCGGAAAAMVLRYWGATGLAAESFQPLVDRSAAGIRTDVLRADLQRRGWNAISTEHDPDAIARTLDAGRPAIALIEDRPRAYHYVVIVGWHPRGVVLHDPAHAAFRVMAVDRFRERWRAANEWMLDVTPREGTRSSSSAASAPRPATRAESLSCDDAIARGISEAQAMNLDDAEQTLSAALSCPGTSAMRELAGVRVLQKRWPDVIELASIVTRQEPGDAYAWRLLATGRFVSDESIAALEAWNRAGQPQLELIDVSGLSRVRQRALERLLFVDPGDVLTVGALHRAGRQLAEWPAMTRTAVNYVPRPGGSADLRVGVTERQLVPTKPIPLGIIAARAAITREVRVPFGPMTADGDRVEVGWRFWPDRPRLNVGLQAPAPWGGLWGIEAASERQPFTSVALATRRRDSASLTLSRWETSWAKWQAGAGIDRWMDRSRYATAKAGLDLITEGDLLRLTARGQSWFGDDAFNAFDTSVQVSRLLGKQLFVMGRLSGSLVSSGAPYDLWPAGDTGQVRATLLRAHPLVTNGRYRVSRLGTEVVTSSLEVQRLFRTHGAQLGPVAFVDIGRTAHRVEPGSVHDVDVGVGLRARAPGVPGSVRVDFAKGLRDGTHALSLIYEP